MQQRMLNLLVALPSFNEIDADTAISWSFCNAYTQRSGLLSAIGFLNPRSSRLDDIEDSDLPFSD